MPYAREIVLRLLGAVQFLTLAPVRMATVPYEEAAVFFPLVGGCIGLASGGSLLLASALGAPSAMAGLLGLAVLVLSTGLLHEDGLADVADGIRAGRTAERMLEIMRDSRIGTYGAAALILAMAVRWQSLTELTSVQPWFVVGATVAAGLLSRASVVLLAAISKPAVSGMAAAFVGAVPPWLLLVTGLQASVAASFLGWRGTAPLLVGGVLIVLLLRAWFQRRIRGVNGDCLGACSVIVECYVLVVAACLRSF